jgi:hypothetical protein
MRDTVGFVFGERPKVSARILLPAAVMICGCAHEKSPDVRTDAPATAATAADVAMANERAAQSTAEEWLSLVDAGNSSQSWTEAATLFKRAVDQQRWDKALDTTRALFGKMLSRTLYSASYAKSLPGAPDGEYVVIKFDTAFEKKQHAIETVTPMKEADGRWRVSGYFVK